MRTLAKTLALLILAAMTASVHADLTIVSNDEFDDNAGATNTGPAQVGGTTWTEVATAAGGTLVESGGNSLQTAGTDNWGRLEYQDNTNYSAPQFTTDTCLQFNWTVGNIEITTDNGNGADYRVQLNANDLGMARGGSAERWVNTSGVMSLDLFFEEDAAAGTPSFQASVFEKDNTIPTDNDGTFLADGVAAGDTGWDYKNSQETFTLTMNDTGYEWTSTYGGFTAITQTWAASTFQNGEFSTGIWGGTTSQNNDAGRGSATFTQYQVLTEGAAVPEPGSALLLCGSLGLMALRRRKR